MSERFADVERFLLGWKPFAELGGATVGAQILTLLAESDPEARREHLLSASDLYRLHLRYQELGLFREGKNERAEQFQRLLELQVDEFAAAIERGEQKELLGLLQFCFEFGRHAAQPRQGLMRDFIHRMLDLPIGGLGIKYSLYSGGVLYSSVGKSHDQMAQDMARLGMGGAPHAGGTLSREGHAEFVFDMASTAYKTTSDPAAVSEPLLRSIHVTGGAEDKVTLRHEDARARS